MNVRPNEYILIFIYYERNIEKLRRSSELALQHSTVGAPLWDHG